MENPEVISAIAPQGRPSVILAMYVVRPSCLLGCGVCDLAMPKARASTVYSSIKGLKLTSAHSNYLHAYCTFLSPVSHISRLNNKIALFFQKNRDKMQAPLVFWLGTGLV